MEQHSVYELIDPRDDLPFYVGISSNPDTRFGQHLSDTTNQEKQKRIQSIHDDGLEPRMVITETWEDRKLAIAREQYWILTYIDWGVPLTNVDYTGPFTKKLPKLMFDHFLDVRTSGRSRGYCALLGLKSVGWLQYFEINDAWDAYLQKQKISERQASIANVSQFIATFVPPPRIPVLRSKDKRHLDIWYDKKQWAVQHPGQIRPCSASI